MINFTAILFWILFGSSVNGQSCPSTLQVITIKDTDVDKEIFNTSVPTGTSVTSFEVQSSVNGVDTTVAQAFFSFGVEDELLTISTTNDFSNLGKLADTDGAKAAFIMYADVLCGGTTNSWPLSIEVTDTFSNSPSFSKTLYEYSVPMPIMTRTDVTVYGDEITVTDINFSNTNMTFSTAPEDFLISSYKIDNKNFKAVFSAVRILQLTENTTYTLTAMNSGSKTQSVQITLVVDTVAGLDTPAFLNSYYKFEFSPETGALTPTGSEIGVDTQKVTQASYSLDGEYSPYFLVTLNNDTGTFDLSLNSAQSLPSNVTGQLVLTLSFTTDYTALSVILIDVLNNIIIPEFSKSFYSGTYDIDSSTITWSDTISITKAETLVLAEGQSSLFNINATDYTITPKNPLEKSDFDDNGNIAFVIIATSISSNVSKATVIVSLKNSSEQDFEFTRPYYTASYADGIVTLDNAIAITGISDQTTVQVSVDSEYDTVFAVVYELSIWTVKVNERLNETILNRNTKLAPTITANLDGSEETAQAVILIKLPDTVLLSFNKEYYTADYVRGDEADTISLTEPISINGADASDITVSVGSAYSHDLKIVLSNSTWIVEVDSSLNSTVLEGNSPILVPITASIDEVGGTAEAVIILTLPESADVDFDSTFYTAKYIKGSSADSVELNQEISLSGIDSSDVVIEVDDEYTSYFSFVLTDGKWSIEVVASLPPTITSLSLVTSMKVLRKSDNKALTSATLVIALPTQESSDVPRFSQTTYEGDYSNSVNPTVNLDQMIALASDNTATVETVAIEDSSFSNNFALTNVGSTWNVTVQSNLSQDVLDTATSLVFTLVATSTDGVKGYATLVITLPKTVRDASVQLANGEILYTTTYNDGAFSDTNIELTTDNDSDITVEISNDLGIDSSYFTYSYSNQTLTINTTKSLDDALGEVAVLPLKLAITDKLTGDTTHAILNVNIGTAGRSDNDETERKALLASTATLAVLLVLVIAAMFFFWYRKIRKSERSAGISGIEPNGNAKTNLFTKNENKKQTAALNNPLRRPTGLGLAIMSPLPEESEATTPDSGKKVAFSEAVEEIDQTNEAEQEDEEGFQSVADRRPTKFIFANPLASPDDDMSNRRESSDYVGYDDNGDRKKSVAFDDNIERMHIDQVEEEDGEVDGTTVIDSERLV